VQPGTRLLLEEWDFPCDQPSLACNGDELQVQVQVELTPPGIIKTMPSHRTKVESKEIAKEATRRSH
jgi:hypothetical protein